LDFNNTYCKIEGCNHRRGHKTSHKNHAASWTLLGLCPCCAFEQFPYGYHPPKGISWHFNSVGRNCVNWIKQELGKLSKDDNYTSFDPVNIPEN
jgi:hypothetical protein